MYAGQPKEVSYYDDDDLDSVEREGEPTAEELDAQHKRCITCANVMLMIMGIGLVGLGFFTGESSYGGAWSAYAVAATGAFLTFVCLLGCIGALRLSAQALRFFYTCMIFSAMALVVLGGFSLILIKQTQNYIETHWDDIVAEASESERDSLVLEDEQSTIKTLMLLCGLACFVVLLVVMSVLSNVVRLVTRVSAYSIMLQSCSITLLPFGVVLIAAGLFIADTAASVEAPTTAFAIFVLGIVVIMLSLLGCFAVTIESRGLLKLFMYIVFVLSFVFLVFGLVALIQSETLKKRLTERWETIRRVLPPTFSGKFDREQFEIFLEANLLLLGFLSVCMGILLGIQWYASIRLRSALKAAAELDEEAAEYGLPSEHRPNRMKVAWKRKWTHGSKSSRRCIKCICCGVLLAFILAIVLATLALYFATSCANFSSFSEDQSYENMGTDVFLHNSYTRGLTHVSLDTTAMYPTNTSVVFTKSAFRSGLQADGFPEVTNMSTLYGFEAVPAAKTKVMGFDISCQLADLELALPPALVYSGNGFQESLSSPSLEFITISDRASIEYDLTLYQTVNRPRPKYVKMSTTSGPIDVAGALFGASGAVLVSDLGELSMKTSDAWCDEDTLGDSDFGVHMTSDRGSVSVEDSTFRNCDVFLEGSAALVFMDNVVMSNNGGGATLTVTGERGLIDLNNVQADVYAIQSDAGSVRVDSLNGTQFRAASTSGSVEALNLRMGAGTVQAETDSGAITVHLAEFRGTVNIVTGGRISCDGTGFTASCDVEEISGQNHVKLASINCINDCVYAGAVTITSARGSVTLTADYWLG